MAKIYIICTSADKKGNTDIPTGLWCEELAAPYNYFKKKGLEVIIASIKGGKIPIDPMSLQDSFKTKEVEEFLTNESAMKEIENSIALHDLDINGSNTIFIPGGLGAMYDMPNNTKLAELISNIWKNGGVISAVCHGPAGLVSVKDEKGIPLVKNKKISCFTNSEEAAVGNTEIVPFLLEDKIKELGGVFERVDDWKAIAITDGKLITGQNPASSSAVAEAIVEAMGF